MTIDDMKQELLAAYRALHDGLSDMIEEGVRLENQYDHQWLVEQLADIAVLDAKLDAASAAEGE